jgi:hypothetical protein
MQANGTKFQFDPNQKLRRPIRKRLRADPADRGVRGRRRADDLSEHAEHRGAAGDEHLLPRHEGAVHSERRIGFQILVPLRRGSFLD